MEAIKIAPFDRYRTMDGFGQCAIPPDGKKWPFTGNGDNIIDLLTPFRFTVEGSLEKRIVGGLLG